MENNNLQTYRVLLEGGEGEIVEKKSRFIATIRRVESEEEAVRFIEEMKKKYWDARHNCSAFVIGSRAELTRCSDDGEPSGTAGRPMLEVLLGEGVRNIAVVVSVISAACFWAPEAWCGHTLRQSKRDWKTVVWALWYMVTKSC